MGKPRNSRAYEDQLDADNEQQKQPLLIRFGRSVAIFAVYVVAGCWLLGKLLDHPHAQPVPPQTISGKWERRFRSPKGLEVVMSYDFQSNGRVRCVNFMGSPEGGASPIVSNDGWYAVSDNKIAVTPTWGSPSFTMSIEPNGDLIYYTRGDDDVGMRFHPVR